MKFKKPNQMVNNKLLLFATVVALWTLATLLIKLIRMLLRWKYRHGKNYAILVSVTKNRNGTEYTGARRSGAGVGRNGRGWCRNVAERARMTPQ